MKTLVLMVLLSGCGNVVLSHPCEQGLPRQCEAEAIVWNQVYGMPDRGPSVEWLDHRLSFPGSAEPADGFFDGYTAEVTLSSAVQHEPQWTGDFSGTTYAHELYHAALQATTGDMDSNHVRPEWKTLVFHARDVLSESGL